MARNAKRDDPLLADAADWLIRVQAAPDDVSLRAALGDWLAQSDAHDRAYRRAERMWRLSGDLPEDYAQRLSSVPRLDDRRAGSTPPRADSSFGRGRYVRRLAGITALVIAVGVAVTFLPRLQLWLSADHSTGTAELRDLMLEDGSAVHLDAASAIAVHYSPSRRDVTLLSGQAFFEVAAGRDRPFAVTAGDVTVTVRGTAFSVRSSANTVSVAVRFGSVHVASKRGPPFIATVFPGQRLDVDRASGRIARAEIALDDIAAWRDWRLVVDAAPLSDIVEELSHYYSGLIVLKDRALAARRVTGVFDLRRPAEALNAVVQTQNGSVIEITPYMLIVSGP